MRLSELKHKEIIDIDSGIRLGKSVDCEISFDIVSGRLIDMMIPKEEDRFRLFGKSDMHLVAWNRIRKIGEDFILIGSYADTDE